MQFAYGRQVCADMATAWQPMAVKHLGKRSRCLTTKVVRIVCKVVLSHHTETIKVHRMHEYDMMAQDTLTTQGVVRFEGVAPKGDLEHQLQRLVDSEDMRCSRTPGRVLPPPKADSP